MKERKKKSIEQRLAENMAKAVEVGDCLEWQGAMSNRSCLPVLTHRREKNGTVKHLSVPKLLYEQSGRTLKTGYIVYRNCCNNRCVNVDHIVSGTKAQWHANRAKKGLAKHSIATKLKITEKARARPTTINSMEKAQEIRYLAAEGLSVRETMERTGVSEAMIVDIRRNHSWKQAGGFFTGLLR